MSSTIASDSSKTDNVSFSGTGGKAVLGEARSETWRKRKNSITFSRAASSLNPDAYNESRRTSSIKGPSSSSHDASLDAVSRSSCGVDCAFESYSSYAIDRTGFRFLPSFFDGVKEKNWYQLEFENDELEVLYQSSQQGSILVLFRMACAFLTLACAAHAVYFFVVAPTRNYFVGPSCYAAITLTFFVMSFIPAFHDAINRFLRHMLGLSLVVAGLLTMVYPLEEFTDVGRFGIATAILTVLYVFLPLNLPVAACLGSLFSLAFEVLQESLLHSPVSGKVIALKILLHLSLNFTLTCISLLSQVFHRNTFWRIGRSLLYQDQLDFELALKEKMIHSVVPEIIASELLEIDDKPFQSIFKHDTSRFRPLMLHKMDSVTILFADIVGFTKMSSTKTAEALVSLLNNLFNRFDKLAEEYGCEKISTLGDCYYCVAGCPQPCDDNADRCLQMGLAMCTAIKKFCMETGEDVNMRVGIHTGTVLCGIVGVHRFKFDVFSNDVQLANQMESGGIAGMVHISQATLDALLDPDVYKIRPGNGSSRNEQLQGITTYLVSCHQYASPKMLRSSSVPVIEVEHTFFRRTPSSFRDKSVASSEAVNPQKELAKRRWIDAPAASTLAQKEDKKVMNSKSFFHVASSDELSPPPKLMVESCDEPESISELLKAREIHEAPRVKVRLSELAASDLLRIGSSSLPSEKSRAEEARKARFQEQQLVIQVLRNNWGRLMELKNISTSELARVSLMFVDKDLEELHRAQFQSSGKVTGHTTFDSPLFSYFLQVVISFLTFLMFTLVFVVTFGPQLSSPWLGVFLLFLLLYLLIVFAIGNVCYVKNQKWAQLLRPIVLNWWVAHIIVSIMLSSPGVLVLANWPCLVITITDEESIYFCFFILQASLTTCLLFTQLHRSVKLAVAVGICGLLVALAQVDCNQWQCMDSRIIPTYRNKTNGTDGCTMIINTTARSEVFLVFTVYLILIVLLNRQYEAASRLNFKSQLLAQVSFEEIQQLKEQADSLLSNLLPDHVCQKVRVSASYSENHDEVGVIFATITNFSDFYSETFEGGIGCIRVLNELISDFDDLLCKPEFASIEKIKTIGATYMAASGLNATGHTGPFQRHDPTVHLRALLGFAMNMQRTVCEFNENMVGYEFVLRVGFNCGPVTAGVVGSTKLLYDIWGNTVNVASRMDSTGVPGRIQVPETCLGSLQGCVLTTPRERRVFVKGKGDMVTHLVDSVIHVTLMRRSVSHDYRISPSAGPTVVVSSTQAPNVDDSQHGKIMYHHDTSTLSSINACNEQDFSPVTSKSTVHNTGRGSDPRELEELFQETYNQGTPPLNGQRATPLQFSSSKGFVNSTNNIVREKEPISPASREYTDYNAVGGGRSNLHKTFSLPSNAGRRIAMKLGQQ